jgi:hypothetical protein
LVFTSGTHDDVPTHAGVDVVVGVRAVVQVREAEVGVVDPTGHHKLSYLCSWRNVVPNRNTADNAVFSSAASAPCVVPLAALHARVCGGL